MTLSPAYQTAKSDEAYAAALHSARDRYDLVRQIVMQGVETANDSIVVSSAWEVVSERKGVSYLNMQAGTPFMHLDWGKIEDAAEKGGYGRGLITVALANKQLLKENAHTVPVVLIGFAPDDAGDVHLGVYKEYLSGVNRNFVRRCHEVGTNAREWHDLGRVKDPATIAAFNKLLNGDEIEGGLKLGALPDEGRDVTRADVRGVVSGFLNRVLRS